jgi:hypothetical protein
MPKHVQLTVHPIFYAAKQVTLKFAKVTLDLNPSKVYMNPQPHFYKFNNSK